MGAQNDNAKSLVTHLWHWWKMIEPSEEAEPQRRKLSHWEIKGILEPYSPPPPSLGKQLCSNTHSLQ
jgi:hypothetical protein